MKTALIFLNGQKPDKKILKAIDFDSKLIICADGALKYLIDFAMPNFLLGDFDSLKLSKYNLPESVEIVPFNSDKDFTDGYLAVETAIKNNIAEIEIYGAFGGSRPDHAYNNYSLLSYALCSSVNAVLKGDKFDVYLIKDIFFTEIKKGKIVSIVPFGDRAHILSTRGLKFPANNLIYDRINPIGSVEGISNESIDNTVEIKLKSGMVLIFIEK